MKASTLNPLPRLLGTALVALAAVAALPAAAQVTPVASPSAFPAGALLVDFTSLTLGEEVNGLSVSGLSFAYSLGAGNVAISSGPGTTNNVSDPGIVTQPAGNTTGTLTISLPGPSLMFGYGFALLTNGFVTDATTLTLLSGGSSGTTVGSLSFAANDDPSFSGGFAGAQSLTPFDTVRISFIAGPPAWAVDNLRVVAVPEPSTALLLAAGGLALAWRVGAGRQRRAAQPA